MSADKFKVSEALSYGWRAMADNFLPLIGFWLLAIVVSVVVIFGGTALLSLLHSTDNWVLKSIVHIIHYLVSCIVTMGLFKIMLDIYDKKELSIEQFFSPAPLIVNYIAGNNLLTIIVCVGTLLFIVPGIYWALQFSLTPYCIIDKSMGPIEALKKSSALTDGIKWQLLGYGVLAFLIHLVGFICLIVGVLPAIMVTTLGHVYIYRKCQEYVPTASPETPP